MPLHCRLTQAGVAVAAAVEHIWVLVLARSLRQQQRPVIVSQGCHPVPQTLVGQASPCANRKRWMGGWVAGGRQHFSSRLQLACSKLAAGRGATRGWQTH